MVKHEACASRLFICNSDLAVSTYNSLACRLLYGESGKPLELARLEHASCKTPFKVLLKKLIIYLKEERYVIQFTKTHVSVKSTMIQV